MAVTIGTRPCGDVVVTDSANYSQLMCVAPAGPGIGITQLRVSIDGSGSASTRFLYDPPRVTAVLGSPCDTAAQCPLEVRVYCSGARK
jgi:hypothetical protein